MNKFSKLALSALVSGAILSHNPVLAEKAIPIKVSEQTINTEDTTKFMKSTGVISEVSKDGEYTTVVVENQDHSLQTIFKINKDVLLYNGESTESFKIEDFKKGLSVEAYYDKNKPMIMIYPAVITPEIMIINEREKMGQVKVGKFGEDLVSLDKELKLNLAETTILLNEDGDVIKQEELTNKELIVFYTVSTKSIPAQTTPSKVVALNDKVDKQKEVLQVIKGDYYMNNDIKMIPIRAVAEFLGYEVKWQQETASVLLEKTNQSYVIKLNTNQFEYNSSTRTFETQPEIKDSKVYVPETIIEMLVD
ncbi:copper amine oxidase N-terminal domain-containing protein [Bacillus sp. Marseille-P3661]|uniref:copper amine oxidase N-terminal domain-containing protein n=1 Tax=Bacillus sp. Marseille-P3661 TaxID=1936234 RepID=UPI000C85C9CB|nr:copper amine oxidase N-terminal domain-containing protein [Bacillus sp. Marseille-P3661]